MASAEFDHQHLPGPARAFVDGLFLGNLTKCLAEHGDLIDEMIERANRQSMLLKAFEVQGLGMTMKRKNMDIWFTILPDNSGENMVRWLQFDRKGLIGHATHMSAQDAIKDAMDCGAHELSDRSTLSSVARGPDWVST